MAAAFLLSQYVMWSSKGKSNERAFKPWPCRANQIFGGILKKGLTFYKSSLDEVKTQVFFEPLELCCIRWKLQVLRNRPLDSVAGRDNFQKILRPRTNFNARMTGITTKLREKRRFLRRLSKNNNLEDGSN